ncbi:hypothetical protein QR77_01275 [Streptomyces sp. 150FB]|uniref:hypothetical protein n=1 Tax=Streptomyces sp. 150FB TaxID=1576605 RepID=UPI0005892221|nr:hypothetical protein [Streptomyces sp. 150FB]KIF72996.1 hypothetical protein QR77_01275 [Streptomyces sp. 150FB]
MTGLWHQVLRTMSQPGASPDDDLLARAAADIALRSHPHPRATADVVLEIARAEFAAVLTVCQAQRALDRARRQAAGPGGASAERDRTS